MPPDAVAGGAPPTFRVRWRLRFGWWVVAATGACLTGIVVSMGWSWFGFAMVAALCGGLVVGATGFVASVLIDAALEDRFGEHSLVTSTISAVGAFVCSGALVLLIARGASPGSLIVVSGCALAAAVPWTVEARRRHIAEHPSVE